MAKAFGFQLLGEQIADSLVSDWELVVQEPGRMIGDTPIEKLLFAALEMRCLLRASEYTNLVTVMSADRWRDVMVGPRKENELTLIVWPQSTYFENRIVDFLVTAEQCSSDLKLSWRKPIIIECDGHDFHERTKEQAAKDRSKDREATILGYETMRFTGSEIWRDPWGCAAQITGWAAKGLVG